jgi:site-specific recombinase XerD
MEFLFERSFYMDSQMHLIEERLNRLPWYVNEFIEHKAHRSSENTLLSYCRDFEVFFNWLVSEGYSQGEAKDVSLEVLETLRVRDIVGFEAFCSKRLGNSTDTIARRISALKSLFHYLSQIAEDENFYPYLKRNVMAKVDVVREKQTEQEKAERISSRILIEQEVEQFREFIAQGYGELVKNDTRKYNAYIRNRERDLAIISLILGSGLRVSEIESLDVDKIDWNNQHVLVKRKGNKHDKVVFSDVALQDLLEYKQIRESRYRPDKSEKAFFLSYPTNNGKATRLTKNAIQKMVNKYAKAFGKGMLSVHKLRHTFATQHYKNNKDIYTLKRQLGHSNINTTAIYTHVFDNTLKESVNKADK